MAQKKPRVIDADGHVIEPWDLWEKYTEAPYKDQALRIVKDNRGATRLMIEGRLYPRPSGPGCGDPWGTSGGSKDGYGKGDPAGLTIDKQMKWLEVEGIDKALLFPSRGLYLGAIEDPGLAAASCRAYNTWLSEFCRSGDAKRLYGAAALPLQNPAEAVKEATRAVKELGLIAAFVRPNVYQGKTLDHADHDSVWAALQDLDLPLMIHEGTGSGATHAAGIDRYQNYFFNHIASNTCEMMLACLSLICQGTLEKFPKLRVAFLEAGANWAPYWLHRMDEHFEKRAWMVPWLKMKPSEYFQRQCWISFDPDEVGLDYTAEKLGDDKVMWASDFPHWDGIFPGAVKELADNKTLSDSVKQKMLGENAAKFLKL